MDFKEGEYYFMPKNDSTKTGLIIQIIDRNKSYVRYKILSGKEWHFNSSVSSFAVGSLFASRLVGPIKSMDAVRTLFME